MYLSFPLLANHEGIPQGIYWDPGTLVKSLRELGGRSLEPTLEDRRAASLWGVWKICCLVRFFVFLGFRRRSPDLQAWVLGKEQGPGTLCWQILIQPLPVSVPKW